MDPINKLLQHSRDVLLTNALSTGAIVAAHKQLQDHPDMLADLNLVSIRDACFACLAADVLNMDGITNRFLTWCKKSLVLDHGLCSTLHHADGSVARLGFQPDQNGLLLFTLWHHAKTHHGSADVHLVKKLADGICASWHHQHFSPLTKDIWGECTAFPDYEESFAYTLGACARGLVCADQLIPTLQYVKVAEKMKHLLDGMPVFVRSRAKHIPDERLDASLLLLTYPLFIYTPVERRVQRLIADVEGQLVRQGGVMRYHEDEYDCMLSDKVLMRKGAGTWPALTLLLSIVHARLGDRRRAMHYYHAVLKHADNYLPQQVFFNKHQQPVQGCVLSHALFVLATKELGYFILER